MFFEYIADVSLISVCRPQLHTIMVSPCWARRVGGEHWQRITTSTLCIMSTQNLLLTDRKRIRTLLDIMTTTLDSPQICSWPRFLLVKGSAGTMFANF